MKKLGIMLLIYGVIVLGILGFSSEVESGFETYLNIGEKLGDYHIVPKILFDLCLGPKVYIWIISTLSIIIGSTLMINNKVKGIGITRFGMKTFFIQLFLLFLFMIMWTIECKRILIFSGCFLLTTVPLNIFLYLKLKTVNPKVKLQLN